MIRKGLVMEKQKNTAVIMSQNGKFYEVYTGHTAVDIGEEYTGRVKGHNSFYKSMVMAASILFMILACGTAAYAYYSPYSEIVVDINPSIQLKTNVFDRIISSKGLNKDGQRILGEVKLRNKTINAGLSSIVEQSKKDNFINNDYTQNGNEVKIQIYSKKQSPPNLSQFKNYVFKNGLNVSVTSAPAKKETKSINKTKQNNSIDKQTQNKNKINNVKTIDDGKAIDNGKAIQNGKSHEKIDFQKDNDSVINKTESKTESKKNYSRNDKANPGENNKYRRNSIDSHNISKKESRSSRHGKSNINIRRYTSICRIKHDKKSR